MDMVEPHWVGIIGTALIMAAFVPQIGVLVKKCRAGGLSVMSSALNIAASALLFGYAVLRGDMIFVLVMGFQLAAAIVILVLNIRYRYAT